MSVKAGYKAAFYIDDKKVSGLASWTYPGETVNMQDIDEFEKPDVEQIPLQMVGGDISISGMYLVDSDEGQQLLQTYMTGRTKVTNLKLYTDKSETIYLKLCATGLNGGASYAYVTNCNNTGVDKSGVGTFNATLHVNGKLEQYGSTSVVGIQTLGEVDVTYVVGDDGTATLWGKLDHRGGDANDIECYFEWGETDSFGTTSYDAEVTFATPDKGEYDAHISGLKSLPTLYYYRAICKLSTTALVYGDTMTFTSEGV